VNAGEDEGTGEFVVVSWNVHGDAGDVAALVGRIRNGRLLGRPAARLVLLLQEVVRRSGDIPGFVPPGAALAGPLADEPAEHADLRITARSLGLNLAYVPSMRNGRSQEDRGNAVLSTFPIRAVDAFELPFGRQRRVAVAATLGGGAPGAPPMRHVSVHFDTALEFSRGGPARWRERQAKALIDLLGLPRVPTVIGGDLNSWWGTDEPAVRELRLAYPEAVDVHPAAGTWRGPWGAGNRLDYLFAAGWGLRVRVARVRERFGSDHTPLYAWLQRTAASLVR
jgi:endonuclease/exonuclease/phosphatase family metal-dependent hydrolase